MDNVYKIREYLQASTDFELVSHNSWRLINTDYFWLDLTVSFEEDKISITDELNDQMICFKLYEGVDLDSLNCNLFFKALDFFDCLSSNVN